MAHGWNVVATTRDPAAKHPANVGPAPCSTARVTDVDSINVATGTLDLLVNNAGAGWLNPIEGTSMNTVRSVFETNTFGTIAIMKAVFPTMRERRSGVVVNVSYVPRSWRRVR